MDYKPSDSLPYQLTAIHSMLCGGLDEMVGTLSDEHFGDERALTIWSNCKKMRLSGYEVTPQSVRDFVLAEAGDTDAAALVDEAVNSPLVSPALAVRTLTTMRARQLASELGKYLVSQDAAKDGVEAVVSKIARFSMSYSVITSEQYQTLGDFMANIDKPGDKPLIITPGFGEIDKHLRFRPGTMNLLAAPPGVGKTATLLNMAVNAAYQGHASLTISLEMPAYDLNARLTAIIAGVSAFNVKEKSMSQQEIDHVLSVREGYASIIDRVGLVAPVRMHVDALLAEISKWQKEKDIKIVFADYAQLFGSSGKSEYEEVTYISKVIMQTAKLAGIPIVAVSSTRRKGKDETGGPSMHDLRSSGKLEYDSNTITMVSRNKDNKNILQMDIVKNRDGGLFGCDLYYDFITQRIRANDPVPFTPKASA
jgi:replicative DNA helicase